MLVLESSNMPRVGWLAVVALLGGLLIACGGSSGSGGASSSIPSGFTRCPQSGDVTKISDENTKGEWKYQQGQGATGGDIEVYAASPGDCVGMPNIKTGSQKLIASAVLTFKDSAAATAAYGGMFGVNASFISKLPGGVTGSATGFGGTSAYYSSPAQSLAAWVSGTKVVAVIGENVSSSDFKNYANGLK